MAFESDDETGPDGPRRDATKQGAEAGSGGLGELSADLPDSPRSSEDADDAIDAAALAALSKGKPNASRANDVEARVNLEGAAALAVNRPSSVPPPAAAPKTAAAPSASRGVWWLLPLVLGFALGVPAGGVIFSGAPFQAPPEPERAVVPSQPSAAERRAREAEAAAAVRLPLRQPEMRVQAATAPSGDVAAPAAPGPADPTPPAEPVARAIAAPEPGPATKAPAIPVRPAAARAPAVAAITAEPAEPADHATSPSPAPANEAAAAVVPPGDTEARTVDALLDDALAGSNQRRLATQADRALAAPLSVPMAPSREDVTRAMTVLLPAIRGCAAGQSGLATVGLVVRNDGRVESVAVSGAPFEGERSGRCMEGVVRRAKFPRFQQSTFRVQFPFAIQ